MSENRPSSSAELLSRIQKAWDELQAFITTLSSDQMTKPTDAAGWTVKDHLVHLAVWEEGIRALLQKQPRAAAMGLDEATLKSRDFDRINAIIQQQHQALALPEALEMLNRVHSEHMAILNAAAYEDLLRPYADFDATGPKDRAVMDWIIGDTYEHYVEHIPWMQAIADKNS